MKLATLLPEQLTEKVIRLNGNLSYWHQEHCYLFMLSQETQSLLKLQFLQAYMCLTISVCIHFVLNRVAIEGKTILLSVLNLGFVS